MAEIILPANNWTPRPHQRRAWAEIQGGKKERRFAGLAVTGKMISACT